MLRILWHGVEKLPSTKNCLPCVAACERAAVQSAGRGHASPKEEQNEAHNLDVGQ